MKLHANVEIKQDYCTPQMEMSCQPTTHNPLLEKVFFFVLDYITIQTFLYQRFKTQGASEIHDTTLRVCFMHKNNKKGLCKHGSLDTSSLSYGPFYLGRSRKKIKCKPIHRKVFIYKLLIQTLGITLLTTTNY
jgi:hypothetical protein